MARSNKNPSDLVEVARSEEGGPQGNALTNLFYPLSADRALKKTEADNPGIRAHAFQDDSILGGPIVGLVGVDKKSGARATLNEGLSTVRHPTKGKGYAVTPEGRALFPNDVEQPHYDVVQADGTTTQHFGLEYGGAAISLDPTYRKLWLEDKATEICEKIRKVSHDIAVIDPQSGNVLTIHSLHTLANYVMSVHVPSDTVEFSAQVDAELRQAHARNLGIDLLDESGHRPNGGTQTDSALTRDRALLKTNSGGAGIRPISNRPHALNSMCHALPMLIDKKN